MTALHEETAPPATSDQDQPSGPRGWALDSFTDEEVALLSTGAPMVVTPYLDLLDDDAREVAAQTAFRSLVARGVLDPPSLDAIAAATQVAPVDGRLSVDLGIRGDVLSAMTLRDAAETVVALSRTAADGHDAWYAHVVGDITLVEEVGPSGLHRFTLTHTVDLPVLLASVAVHGDAADGPAGGPVLLPDAADGSVETPPALLERLGEAHLRADVVVLSRTDPEAGRPSLTGLLTGPAGCWTLVSDPAAGTLSARPETVAAVHARLAALVAGATSPATGAAS